MESKTSPQPHEYCDVAVIGAGLSGIWAAHLLKSKGLQVLVFEAQDRIGGRILTESSPVTPFVDGGAQYISKGQSRILSLLKKWDFETFPCYETGKTIYFQNGKLSVAQPSLKDPDETNRVAKILNEMAESVPLEKPWSCPNAHEWDNQTLEKWLQDNTQSKYAQDQILMSIEGVYQTCPGKTSLLGSLFCIKSGDPLEAFLSPSEDPELRVEGGIEPLLHAIAESLHGQIILNAAVKQVHYDHNSVEIKSENITVKARHAIITLPPATAARIQYTPPLSSMRDQLAEKTPLGWVTKVHCTYQEPFWRSNGLSGSVISDSGFAKICADNSPSSGHPGILLAFIQGPDAVSFEKLSLVEKKKTITNELVGYFGSPAENLIGYHEKSWHDDPHCRGCYGGYYPCSVWTEYGPALRKSIGPLHWAGTETSAIWNGKMEGALLSAEVAVSKISDF